MRYMFVIDCNLSGGAERVISILANYFNKNKAEVILLNFDKDSNFYPIDEGVEVVKLAQKYPCIGKNKNKVFKRIHIICKTIKEIKRYNPDVIIPFLFDAELSVIPYCALHKIPCITSVRNDANAYPNYQRIFRRFFYPHISAVVFQSKAVREHVDYKNLKNAFVIPNPVSIKRVEHRDLPINKNKIISVGRLTEQKNHELTIRAINRVLRDYPEIELHIFGDGPLKEQLCGLVNELNLTEHVFLDGVIENAQYINRDACAFVMSSKYEGFPNALLEAMACHIPAICSNFNSGTAAEALMDGKAGWLVKVDDIQELEQAIRVCIENRSLAEEKADIAVAHCKDYSLEIIGNKWGTLITNCVASRKHGTV